MEWGLIVDMNEKGREKDQLDERGQIYPMKYQVYEKLETELWKWIKKRIKGLMDGRSSREE